MAILDRADPVERPSGVWEHRRVISGFRMRRGLAVAGVLVALAFAVPRIFTHTPYARLGVRLEWSEADDAFRVQQVVGPPSLGLLRSGDLLIEMDGIPIRKPSLTASYGRAALPKEPITFLVRRGTAEMPVTVPSVRLSIWQRVRHLMVPLAAMVAAPLVAFALFWRRPDLGTAGVFLWFAALQAVTVVHEIYRHPEAEPSGAFRLFMGLYGWVVLWLPAAFLHFMAVFPRARWHGAARWRSAWFWLVAAAYVVPLAFVVRLVRTGVHDENAFGIFQSVALVIGVVSLAERYGRRGAVDWRPSRSQRALGLFVAAMFLAEAVLGWMLRDERFMLLMQHPLLRVATTVISFGGLTTPFILAFLIARDPAFDPRRILEKSLPYAMLSGVLAALYVGIVLLGQHVFETLTGEQALVFNVIAALVVAFVFAPLREHLQRALDRLFRRDPRVLRAALDQAGRELLGALDRDEVRASVASGLTRGLGRQVTLEWPEAGVPRPAPGEELSEDARGAVDNLLLQAGIRLENLGLQEQRVAAERSAMELREAATRAELRALHAQVQPHFLFNALNALSYLTETDAGAAQRFTERLADMLRYTVEAGERSSALLADEIDFVEDYIGVARERYEGDLSFRFQGERELLSAAVPPLLLQPLVENSLKHGFDPERARLAMTLEASRDDGWLTLRFADDGPCNGNGTRVAGLGVGLDNLEQRIRRFGGPEATMHAGVMAGGGFAVTLRWRDRQESGA